MAKWYGPAEGNCSCCDDGGPGNLFCNPLPQVAYPFPFPPPVSFTDEFSLPDDTIIGEPNWSTLSPLSSFKDRAVNNICYSQVGIRTRFQPEEGFSLFESSIDCYGHDQSVPRLEPDGTGPPDNAFGKWIVMTLEIVYPSSTLVECALGVRTSFTERRSGFPLYWENDTGGYDPDEDAVFYSSQGTGSATTAQTYIDFEQPVIYQRGGIDGPIIPGGNLYPIVSHESSLSISLDCTDYTQPILSLKVNDTEVHSKTMTPTLQYPLRELYCDTRMTVYHIEPTYPSSVWDYDYSTGFFDNFVGGYS